MRSALSMAVFAAFASFSLVSCNEQKTEKEAPLPPAVVVAPVVKSNVAPVDEYIGQTKAQDEVDLVARVQGFLTKRNFNEGQMVKEGELLFQIEKAQYEASVENCQGALAAVQAKCKDAVIDFNRQSTLWKQGVNAQKDYDTSLYNKLAIEADVAQADAKLKTAKLDLSYTDINAPFDGCVGLASYSVGNMVGTSSGKLATIVRINPMRVQFNVDEMDILRYNIKMASLSKEKEEARLPDTDRLIVRIKFQNGEIYPEEGVLSYTDNHINTSTGTMLVQAQFPNSARVLVPGMYVKVMISKRIKEEALLIPSKAALENQSGRYVFVVDKDSKVSSRMIKAGRSYGTLLAVTSGLAEGERVITEGIQKVRPGSIVSATVDKVDTETAAEASK
jgi:membrane fusion protein, multidrug efflux system